MISIVITCHADAEFLPKMLYAIKHQRNYLVGTCPKTGQRYKYAAGDFYSDPIEVIVSSNGRYEGEDLTHIYPYKLVECPYKGFPGHNTRGPGINAATGDFVILTNQDNDFVGGAIYRIEEELTNMTGMVYWDCVHNVWAWTNAGGSKLLRGRIDLTCAAVKLDIAKQVGFPFKNLDGDFDYIDACHKEARRQGLEVKYIPGCLAIHN